MRAGIIVTVTPEDRRRLEAVVSDRNAPQKHVWRAHIILATAQGCGTFEVMRWSGKSKPVVWRWQARFAAEGVEGLLRDKTRRHIGKAPLPPETVQRVVDLALGQPPGETTHWTGRRLATVAGVSLRSVQRILEAHQSHRIASAPSSCRRIRSSPTSSRTSSGSMSIRRPTPSCCRSTRRARSSARPHPAGAADEEGSRRHHDP